MADQTEIIQNAGWASDIQPQSDLRTYTNTCEIFKATCVSGTWACILEIVIHQHNILGYTEPHLNVRFYSKRSTDGTRIRRHDFPWPSQIQNFMEKHNKHPDPKYFPELMGALFSTSEKKPIIVTTKSGFKIIFFDRVNEN